MLQSPTRFVQGRSIALGLIVIPVLLFYAALLHQLTNIPFADDYAVLNFIHNLNLQPGALAKASYILSVQFNEYKVPLEAVVFTAQYSFLGHINFIGLCMLGNAAILLLGVVLWKMFLPSLHHEPRRVALFIPVSWLLFQLSYGETLNWAAPGIQNLYVIGFSFAAFLLLDRAGRWAFTGALAFLVLAIAASGNGLIAAFTGFIALAVSRRFRRLAAWTAVTLMMMLVYAYHYNPSSSQSSRHDSVFQALLHVKVFYGISFLGGAAGVVEVPNLPRLVRSIALGFALCAFFGYLALRRELSANRAVNCAVAFLFLTGLGVAGIRSGMGMLSSLNSRYRIYSDLLLIFVWFFVCERRLQFFRQTFATKQGLPGRLHTRSLVFAGDGRCGLSPACAPPR